MQNRLLERRRVAARRRLFSLAIDHAGTLPPSRKKSTHLPYGHYITSHTSRVRSLARSLNNRPFKPSRPERDNDNNGQPLRARTAEDLIANSDNAREIEREHVGAQSCCRGAFPPPRPASVRGVVVRHKFMLILWSGSGNAYARRADARSLRKRTSTIRPCLKWSSCGRRIRPTSNSIYNSLGKLVSLFEGGQDAWRKGGHGRAIQL